MRGTNDFSAKRGFERKNIMITDIVIPVFNEEKRLAENLPRLHRFLAAQRLSDWRILIANNGSTDGTQAVAEHFSRELQGVDVLWIPEKGRGGALKRAWLDSQADVLTYMDVDLATDLMTFPTLVGAVASRMSDIAVGSRLLKGAKTSRGWRREVISQCYVFLVRSICGIRCSDTQCGFKAISRAVAQVLLPEVKDSGWFFDTELLVLAQKRGYRTVELPVIWHEDRETRVKVLSTALEDFRGLWRLRRELSNPERRNARTRGSPGAVSTCPDHM